MQTIHAFCTHLLHQFPFEADVAARFEVLDEAATAQILNRLTLDVLLEGATKLDSDLGKALDVAIAAAADVTFKDVIAETIGKRDLITAWMERAGGVQRAIGELTRNFELPAGDTLQVVENEYLSKSLIPQAEWPALIGVFSSGSKTDQERASSLSDALRASGRERIENYLDVFCTGDRKGRASVLTKKPAEANPQWAARLNAEKDRVCQLLAREFALRARDRSAALITVAAAVIDRYRAEKERHGLLDYEDLIDKALGAAQQKHGCRLGALQARSGHRSRARRRSAGHQRQAMGDREDAGRRRISAWRRTAGNVRRTLFAVGDEKQSIFSFQGAEPRKFARKCATISRASTNRAKSPFTTEKLRFSFRSAAECSMRSIRCSSSRRRSVV